MLRFGTDGVRGVANADLSPEYALALGRAVARALILTDTTSNRHCLIARDTRRSGGLLAAALSAGLASEGVDVIDAGVLPTPGLAVLSSTRVTVAAMITASHNPFGDNGIKVFATGGRKLSDDEETRLESALDAILAGKEMPVADEATLAAAGWQGPAYWQPPTGAAVGKISRDANSVGRYSEHLVELLGSRRLNGVRVVLDCAHGAASEAAPEAFTAAGASVVKVLGNAPDGVNINSGVGSTAPQKLAEAVVAAKAEVGLAFDGDADRVIAVDEHGEVVDGDRLLALFAVDMRDRRILKDDTVVVTVMTNLGFHKAMEAAGINVEVTSVGDRHVLEVLDSKGLSLGGEQSGHIVFRDLATTGDGVLSGLQLLELLGRSRKPLSTLAAQSMTRLPQVLYNVKVADRDGLEAAKSVWDEVRAVETELGGQGRVLLRPSGTEPLIRVMVEAPTHDEADVAANRIAEAVGAALT